MALDAKTTVGSDPVRAVGAPSRGPRLAIAALLVGFVLLATAYNVVVPVFETPDEHTHFFFAQHVARTGRLPVQTDDSDTRGPWEQEGSQPPLYYLLAAPLVTLAGADLDESELWYNHQNTMGHPALAGNENRFVHAPESEAWPWHGYALATHLARALSTLMGAATVLLVWWIARRVIPDRDWLAVGAAAVVAFLPQFVFTSASLSNDNLVIVLATAALALTLRISEGHDDWPTIAALAIVAGLAALAKLSGLAVLGFTVLTLAGLAWHRRDARLLARTAIPVTLAGLILSGWWYVRNWQLYGDVTGISHMLPGHTRRDFEMAEWLAGLPSELVGMWYSAWGLFGWFTIMLPGWVYALATVLTLAAAAGLVVAARRKAPWISWARLAWLGLWAVVVLVSLLRWMMIAKGAHGRLLYPAIAFAAIAVIAGWRALVPQRVSDRLLAGAVTAVFLALSMFSLFGVMRPAFASPSAIAVEDIPESAVPADVVFGEGLRLVAAELPERAVGGEVVPITLYWQAEAPIERDGFVAVRFDQTVLLPDTDAEGGYRAETHPGQAQLSYLAGGTSPPAFLEPGDRVFVDERLVAVPLLAHAVHAAPGPWCDPPQPREARLSVHLYDQGAGEAWPAASADGHVAGDWRGTMVIDPSHRIGSAPDGDVKDGSLLARFDNGIELVTARPGPCHDDHRLWLEGPAPTFEMDDAGAAEEEWPSTASFADTFATWLPAAPVDEDLTAFIHVVDGQGNLVATFDRPPATYSPYRTSLWQEGEAVVTQLPWWMFDDAANGRSYSVFVGLYRPSDGSRVPAFRPDGTRWPNDAVELLRVKAPEPDALNPPGPTDSRSSTDG